jgi:acetamidase/formamidase
VIGIPDGRGRGKMVMLYKLTAGPKTIHWGYLSSSLRPVLEIVSGDIVTIEEFGSFPLADCEAAGIPPDLIPQALRDIFSGVQDRGPGFHILTGPLYIDGAEPGDMLAVHIKEIELMLPFGCNVIKHGRGTLPEDFPYDSTRFLSIDRGG